MEKSDIVFLGSSLFSGFMLVIGFIFQQIVVLVPIGSVTLAGLIGYYFQKRMHRDIRKYEMKKLAVVEALGPLHGGLMKIVDIFESNKGQYVLDLPSSDIWEQIRSDYRYYLVPEELRVRCEEFFIDLHQLPIGAITNRINRIAKDVKDPALPKGCVLTGEPHFRVEQSDGTLSEACFLGLVFWKATPTQQRPGKLLDIILEISCPIGGPSEITLNAKAAEDFANRFLDAVWREADRDAEIVSARKMHEQLHGEAIDLFGTLKDEIVNWAE